MPCDSRARAAAEAAKRQKQIEDLIAGLKVKSATITRDALGRVTINGWTNRGDWCDECAVRALRQSTDFTIRNMIANAAPAGRVLTFGHTHTHGGVTHTH